MNIIHSYFTRQSNFREDAHDMQTAHVRIPKEEKYTTGLIMRE